MSKTVFVIFEKSFLIRQGLITLLKEIEHSEISGDYDHINQFASVIGNHQPDVIFIGNKLYDKLDVNELKSLQTENKFSIIVLTEKNNVISDPLVNEQIFDHDGRIEILHKIKLANQKSNNNNKKKKKDNNKISKREKAVLACVAKGLTNKEIAEELFISTHTAITHRKNIVRKLGIKTVSGLTVYAILNKIIDMSDLK
jgi:DNA-binding NarL/FixJ family response regulator